MDAMNCPRCGQEMNSKILGTGRALVCPAEHGVFLERAELGNLVEAETDWHRNAGQHTAPLPKITPDMTAPPASKAPARAWVETLFR